jgi:hypothetical protein
LRLLARSDDALQRTVARLLVAAVFMKAIGLKSIDGAENAIAPRLASSNAIRRLPATRWIHRKM